MFFNFQHYDQFFYNDCRIKRNFCFLCEQRKHNQQFPIEYNHEYDLTSLHRDFRKVARGKVSFFYISIRVNMREHKQYSTHIQRKEIWGSCK